MYIRVKQNGIVVIRMQIGNDSSDVVLLRLEVRKK